MNKLRPFHFSNQHNISDKTTLFISTKYVWICMMGFNHVVCRASIVRLGTLLSLPFVEFSNDVLAPIPEHGALDWKQKKKKDRWICTQKNQDLNSLSSLTHYNGMTFVCTSIWPWPVLVLTVCEWNPKVCTIISKFRWNPECLHFSIVKFLF